MGKDLEMIEASKSGNIALLHKLLLGLKNKRSGLASLRRGPGVNIQDASGYSSLHHASLHGHTDVVRLLLQYDATPNLPDTRGSSALHLAAWAGHQDICKLLLTHLHRPANPNLQTVDHCTPLHCAAQHGHTGALTTLLAHGADPNVQNVRNETPLDLAAQYGRIQVVQMLIRAHPELLLPLKYESSVSHSPLHLASRNGHKNVVEVLLLAGVHVNLLTPRGTALHEAALTGKDNVVRLLLSAGSDLDITDCDGRTVLDLLEQFPPHVTKGIVSVIHNYRNASLAYLSATESDDMKENNGPQIMTCDRRGHRQNHHYGNRKYRRSISPFTYDTSGEREDSSPMHHPWNSYHEETTSPSSSMGSIYGVSGGPPSPLTSRPRSATTDASLYLPMKPKPPKKPPRRNLSVSPTYLLDGTMDGSHTFGGRSPSSHSDRMKPDKRQAYEFLHLSKSGEIPITTRSGAPPKHLPPHPGGSHKLNRSATVDQYVEMKAVLAPPRQHLQTQNFMKTLPAGSGQSGTAIPIVDNENHMIRAINPNRKLRRNRDLDYENHSLEHRKGISYFYRTFITISPRVVATENNSQYNNDYDDNDGSQCKKLSLTPLSPTHYQQPPTPEHPPPAPYLAEKCIHERIRPLSQEYKRRSFVLTGRDICEYGTSPPLHDSGNGGMSSSALAGCDFRSPSVTLGASNGSLSSSVSLSDRSASTDCVEEFIGDVPFAGLFKGSTMALDNINGYCQQPIQKQPEITLRPTSLPPQPIVAIATIIQRPKSLTRTLRSLFSSSSTSSENTPPPVADNLSTFKTKMTNNNNSDLNENDTKISSTATNKETLPVNINHQPTTAQSNHSIQNTTQISSTLLSPFDEQEEWAKISEIMATFGSSLARDSTGESFFADEVENEFRQRLTRSASTDGTASLSLICLGKSDSVVRTPLGSFLHTNGLDHIEKVLIDDGYDNVDFLHGIIDEQDLPMIGIPEADRSKLMDAITQQLPKASKLEINNNLNNNINGNGNHSNSNGTLPSMITVEQWLQQIKLDEYIEVFKKNLYTDMERIYRVWEIELQAVLEIDKLGHRKRILYSVSGQRILAPNLDEINADVDNLKTNLQQLKDDFPQEVALKSSNNLTKRNPPVPIGRHRKNRPAPKPPTQSTPNNSLEIRGPNELLLGVPCGLRAQWKHSASTLISGSVRYEVNYLGSTIVKELRGTESTRKSIQKLKRGDKLVSVSKPATVPEEEGSPTNTMESETGPSSMKSNSEHQQNSNRSVNSQTRRPVCLSINHRGVQFLDIETDNKICEHEIRNIDCACQDADDLSHFAYITKDQHTHENYCHVFNVFKMDLATEIILTLGQAFEVAYQLALREISPTTISKLF